MKQQTADVIIVGGGMVGATLALALIDTGLDIALIEAREPEKVTRKSEVEMRVSAVSRASQRIFDNLGAWDAMAELRVCPYREMRVWDSAGSGAVHFDSAEIGEANLGWIIENRVIQQALWGQFHRYDNLRVLCPAAIETVELERGGARVTLDKNVQIEAPLLVGADGSQSRVRETAGIATTGWAYGQKAVVATVRCEQEHQHTAWQRFLPTGPLAFLPLADGRCSIVWSTGTEHAEELLGLADEDFLETLSVAFDHRLGAVIETGPRAAFDLRLQNSQRYVQPNLALVGDAAHVVHPLAGQGVNLGLLDAASLAQTIENALNAGRSPGALLVLRRYERWRRGDNMLMMAATDGIQRLFSNEVATLGWVRNTGLDVFDSITPLKNLISRQASGLEGELPRLARARPVTFS